MSDTAANATGIAGAAQAFESILAGEIPDTETAPSEQATGTAPAEEAEAVVGGTEGDETAETAPEGEAAADEEPAETTEPETQLVTVTINGKTEQVPLEEAIRGYQRQADYSRKTAALADERMDTSGMPIDAQLDHIVAGTDRAARVSLLDALDSRYSFELPPSLVHQEFAAVWAQVEQDLEDAENDLQALLDFAAQPDACFRVAVVVSNVAGTVTSATATLTVNTTPVAPTITTPPSARMLSLPRLNSPDSM